MSTNNVLCEEMLELWDILILSDAANELDLAFDHETMFGVAYAKLASVGTLLLNEQGIEFVRRAHKTLKSVVDELDIDALDWNDD